MLERDILKQEAHEKDTLEQDRHKKDVLEQDTYEQDMHESIKTHTHRKKIYMSKIHSMGSHCF